MAVVGLQGHVSLGGWAYLLGAMKHGLMERTEEMSVDTRVLGADFIGMLLSRNR